MYMARMEEGVGCTRREVSYSVEGENSKGSRTGKECADAEEGPRREDLTTGRSSARKGGEHTKKGKISGWKQ